MSDCPGRKESATPASAPFRDEKRPRKSARGRLRCLVLSRSASPRGIAPEVSRWRAGPSLRPDPRGCRSDAGSRDARCRRRRRFPEAGSPPGRRPADGARLPPGSLRVSAALRRRRVAVRPRAVPSQAGSGASARSSRSGSHPALFERHSPQLRLLLIRRDAADRSEASIGTRDASRRRP